MKHTMVTFRLHRRGVALVALGAMLQGGLLFAAGYLAGTRRSGTAGVAAPRAPSLTLPAQPAAAVKPAAASGTVSGVVAAQDGTAGPEAGGAFALRVGVFAEAAEAEAFGQEMAGRGHQPSVVAVATRDGAMLHAVLVGRYGSRGEAARAAADLARDHGVAAAVVPADPDPPERPGGP